MFSHLALTVTFSLIASLVVAITFIPMVSSIEFKSSSDHQKNAEKPKGYKRVLYFFYFGIPSYFLVSLKYAILLVGKIILLILSPLFKIFDLIFGGVIRIYPHILIWALKNKFLMVTFSLFLLVASIYSIEYLGSEFLPEVSQGEFQVFVSK